MGKLVVRIALMLGLVIGTIPFTGGTAGAYQFGSPEFDRTWARTDLPVSAGQVNRTWMWGPSGHSAPFNEPYYDAPGGVRMVQYTDKSRMEDNSYRASAPWDVTNGRLAYELISGEMQVGDDQYVQRQPANVQIAGDAHPDSPTYQSFNQALDDIPVPVGLLLLDTIDRHGNTGVDFNLDHYDVRAAHYVAETDHSIASVFWDFMNSSGPVYENGQYADAPLFENPYFATGYPVTEAYWMYVPVGGQWKDVLAQCFERRCLTYTPGNPAGWQVEAGNIGQHYFRWRYGDAPPPPPSGATHDEVVYLQEVDFILEATEYSFELFLYLLENPTFTQQWWDDFDLVIAIWWGCHPYLEMLQPPEEYREFHELLLDAYYELAWAADDMHYGVYNNDPYWIEEGFLGLDFFLEMLEEAFDHFPGTPPGYAVPLEEPEKSHGADV